MTHAFWVFFLGILLLATCSDLFIPLVLGHSYPGYNHLVDTILRNARKPCPDLWMHDSYRSRDPLDILYAWTGSLVSPYDMASYPFSPWNCVIWHRDCVGRHLSRNPTRDAGNSPRKDSWHRFRDWISFPDPESALGAVDSGILPASIRQWCFVSSGDRFLCPLSGVGTWYYGHPALYRSVPTTQSPALVRSSHPELSLANEEGMTQKSYPCCTACMG